jgi:hypothetical protein
MMLWMLGVSPSEAAPIGRPQRATHPVYGAPVFHQRAHARPRVKVTKSQRRDARRVVPIHLMVRRHVSGWLQRSGSRPFQDFDAAAIQSGAAVGASDDPRLRASLQPIGMLAEAQREKTVSQTVVRRAPRGPPPSPWLKSPASA